MFKQALYTYWMSLHPRNLKYILEKRWPILVLLLGVFPNYIEIREHGVGAFYSLTVVLPVILMKLSNLAGKLNIPKALYLAPMQVKQRRQYIKYLIVIKIGVSMLLGLVIQLVWYVICSISVADILVCISIYLGYGIAEYFCVEGTLYDGNKIEHGIREKDGRISWS